MADFFAGLTKLATPYVKPTRATANPIEVARAKFATAADEQIALLKTGAQKGYWFAALGTGYVVTLKNGPTILNKTTPSYQVASAGDAVKFIEGAKKAAATGDLDTYFEASKRKTKEVKPAAKK